MQKPKPENQRQYHAFEIYRDLGVGRSRREVARRVGAAPDTVCKWSKLYRWDERLVEYQDVVKRKQEEGALVKVDDPVIKKMLILLEQTEALIDSVFLPDDTGRRSPTIHITSVEELTKLVKEYRQMLESYYKFVAEYKPQAKAQDRATKIDKFNVFMGNVSQQDRIQMMESLKNGNVPGRDSQLEGGVQDADYNEVPERGDED